MFPHYAKFKRGFTQAINQDMLEDICRDHPEYDADILGQIKRNLVYLHLLNSIFYQQYVYTYSNKEGDYADNITSVVNYLFKAVYNNILVNLSQYKHDNTARALEETQKALEAVSKGSLPIDAIIDLDNSSGVYIMNSVRKGMNVLGVIKELDEVYERYDDTLVGIFYSLERHYSVGREPYDYFGHIQDYDRRVASLLHLLKELDFYRETATTEGRNTPEIRAVEDALPDLVAAITLDLALLTARNTHYYGLERMMDPVMMVKAVYS